MVHFLCILLNEWHNFRRRSTSEEDSENWIQRESLQKTLKTGISTGRSLNLGDGQFSERCDVDGSFFNSDAILIIFGKA